jgi:ubiquinone/menaquinone biosynthesis C-methylase UbiE
MNNTIEEYRGTDELIEDPLQRFNLGQLDILPHLVQYFDIGGNVLELGAGCCWFSSELSKLEKVRTVVALDFSTRALDKVAPKVMKTLNAKAEKITRVVGDFYKLDFETGTFDFVFFDAALHHIETNKFHLAIKEAVKVLKRSGKLIAIREPFLTPLPILKQIRRKKNAPMERSHGVTENTYTKNEWRALFRQCGYEIQFIPSVRIDNRHPNSKFFSKKKDIIRNLFPFIFTPPQYIIVTKP